MSNSDAQFRSEVLRYDDAQIIATKRELALFLGVRLAYDSAGYKAGDVLSKNSTSGLFQKYDPDGASGTDAAKAVLEKAVAATEFDDTTHSVANSVLTHAIFGGVVFYAKLNDTDGSDLDSNGVTDLGGRRIVDVTGVELLKF